MTTWTACEEVNKATTWSGENKGDSIYGVVDEFKEVTRKDGSTGNVLVLTNPDSGETYNVWTKSMLLRIMNDIQVQPGMLLKLEYLGKQQLAKDKSKSFRAYKVYRGD